MVVLTFSLSFIQPEETLYDPSRENAVDTSDGDTVFMIGGNPDMRSVEHIAESRLREKERGQTETEDYVNDDEDELQEEMVPNDATRRRKRFVLNDARRQWTHGIIPYQFHTDLPNSYRRNYLQVVFRQLEYWTHFRFVPWNASVASLYDLGHNNYLIFLRSGSRCWSYVGNNPRWRGQRISCCRYSRCLHEIGHAIGFYHEQANPLRDDYVRINYENIIPGAARNFKKYNLNRSRKHFGYYDISSIMSYDKKAFSKNGFDTISTLDDDALHLGDKKDKTGFYMFYEAQMLYHMQETKCPYFPLTCVNDGYVSYIDGRCRCRCTSGMDYKTGCATPLGADVWPEGLYSMLKAGHSCPSGFHHIEWSMSGISTDEPILLCSKTYLQETGSGYTWSPGNYCIVQAEDSECSQGYEEDQPDTLQPETTTEQTPSKHYLTICCRDDGLASTPIKLPVQKPFALLSKRDVPCQNVEGLIAEEIYLATLENFGFKMCSYRRHEDVTQSLCGDMINMGQYNSHVSVTSPQYPLDYTGTESCTWFLKVRSPRKPNKLEFTDFELHKAGRDCNGHVEIRSVLPGQPGIKYCGSGFAKTVISHSNSLQLTLTSHKRPESPEFAKRFNASVTLLRAEDLCYTNGGRDNSYHGSVNITRNFKPCLPWSQATRCRYNAFSETETDLIENHCRNPGHGTAPWCYTDADNCQREYCDVCQLRRCHNLFQDCQQLIETGEDYCNRDPEASRGCRESCGLCEIKSDPKSVSMIRCLYPSHHPVDGVVISELKTKYHVGEQITYRCNSSSNATRRRVCTSEGVWSHIGKVCQGRTLCMADRTDCNVLIEQVPQMCKEYRNFAFTKCARTCGVCSIRNGIGVQGGCNDPGQSFNTSIVRNGPWVQGDFVQYRCKAGFVLTAGQLYRACQENGQLTGSKPVCIALNETETELYHIPLRRRRATGTQNQVYTLSNDRYRINRTGEIVSWSFYSLHSGRVQFQVWRQLRNTQWFRLLGVNNIQDTRSDRLTTSIVKEDERIPVSPGDFIAIYFPPVNAGGVTFDPCKGYHNPEGLSPWVPIQKTSMWRPGLVYAMRRQMSCKLFSVSATIGPDTNTAG